MNAPLVPDPSSRESTVIAPLMEPAAVSSAVVVSAASAVLSAVSVVLSAAAVSLELLPHPATEAAVIAIIIIATIVFFIIDFLSFIRMK